MIRAVPVLIHCFENKLTGKIRPEMHNTTILIDYVNQNPLEITCTDKNLWGRSLRFNNFSSCDDKIRKKSCSKTLLLVFRSYHLFCSYLFLLKLELHKS